MPRFRNLFDFSSDDVANRPHETLIDIPVNDSVKVITLHFEDSGDVQLRRIDSSLDWEVITTFDTVTKRKSNHRYVRS